MSERIVDLVTKKYNRRFDVEFDDIKTKNIVLNGGEYKDFDEVKTFVNLTFNYLNDSKFNNSFTIKDAEYLIHNYGKQTDIVLEKFEEINQDSKDNFSENLIKAEVWFTITHEMTLTPTDFFTLRTGRMYFDMPSVKQYKNVVISEFTNYFAWKEEVVNQQRELLEKSIETLTTFE